MRDTKKKQQYVTGPHVCLLQLVDCGTNAASAYKRTRVRERLKVYAVIGHVCQSYSGSTVGRLRG